MSKFKTWKKYLRKITSYMDDQQIRGKISFLRIFLDICWCNVRYGSTISDYFLFRFYKKNHLGRKEFMTAKDKRRFYAAVNDKVLRYDVQNKDVFNEKFAEYIKRDFICIPECSVDEFKTFVNNHGSVFVKPIGTGGGEGILKISSNDENLVDIYNSVCAKGMCVVEAAIIQHHELAALHPQSLNSVRITTFFDGENVKILFAALRCGTGGSFVDNHMLNGIAMEVDVGTGKVSSRASSKKMLNIVRHPDSGVFLPGFQLPHWDKCLKLVNEVAHKTPGVHYVGWDIAITEDDVCLIEANPGGDFSMWQEPAQRGCKAQTDKLMEDLYTTKN